MNKSETAAYEWLAQEGHTGIVFNRRGTPDFETDQGSFEVKKLYGSNLITFTPYQKEKTIRAKATVLVFREGEKGPFVSLDPSELGEDPNVVKDGIRIHIFEDSLGNRDVFKVRLPPEVKIAFDEFVVRLEKETGSPKVSQAEAMAELLRRAGIMAPKQPAGQIIR